MTNLGGGATRHVRVVFEAVVGQYRAGLASMSAQTRAWGTATGAQVAMARQQMGTMAGTINQNKQDFNLLGVAGLAAGYKIGQGLMEAKDEARDFQSELVKMRGLVGLSQDEVNTLGQAALDLRYTGRGPLELARAMYFVTSAGIQGSAALEVVENSARAAAAGLGTTEAVADAISSALNAYGKANLSAADATDILVNTVREGKGEADDVALSIGRVIPIAAELGVEFHEVGAAIAVMTRTGTTAETSVVNLRGILGQFLKPSAQAQKAFGAMGTSAAEMRDEIANKGLLPALVHLRERMAELGPAEGQAQLGKIIEDQRALTGFLALTGKGLEENKGVFESLAHSMGLTDDAFNLWAGTAEAAEARFSASMEAIRITFGRMLLPVTTGLANLGTSFTNFLGGLPAPLQAAAVALAGLSGAALLFIGGAVLIIPRIEAIITALGLLRGAAAAAGGALQFLFLTPAGLALTALVGGTILLERALSDAREEGKALASDLLPGFVQTQEQAKKGAESVDQLAAAYRNAQRAKRDFSQEPFKQILGDKGFETASIPDLRSAARGAIGQVEEQEQAPWWQKGLGAIGFDVGAEGRRKNAIGDITTNYIYLRESVRLARDAMDGMFKVQVEDAGRFDRALRELGITADDLPDRVNFEDWTSGAFSENEANVITAHKELIMQATAAGASEDELAKAIFILATQGEPGVSMLQRLAGVTVDNAEAADKAEEEFDQMAEAMEQARQSALKLLISFDKLADSQEGVTGKDALQQLVDNIQDAHQKLEELHDQEEENLRYLVRTPERERELRKIRRDIEDTQNELNKLGEEQQEAKKSPLQRLDESLASNAKLVTDFLENLEYLRANGEEQLAATFAAMGPSAAAATKEAVDKIKSGQGLGSIPLHLRDAIIAAERLAKQTMAGWADVFSEEGKKDGEAFADGFIEGMGGADLISRILGGQGFTEGGATEQTGGGTASVEVYFPPVAGEPAPGNTPIGIVSPDGTINYGHTGGLLQRMHGGGKLRGDEVPIIGQVGEWMHDRQTTAFFGADHMRWMKAAARRGDQTARMPRMHDGGGVGEGADAASTARDMFWRWLGGDKDKFGRTRDDPYFGIDRYTEPWQTWDVIVGGTNFGGIENVVNWLNRNYQSEKDIQDKPAQGFEKMGAGEGFPIFKPDNWFKVGYFNFWDPSDFARYTVGQPRSTDKMPGNWSHLFAPEGAGPGRKVAKDQRWQTYWSDDRNFPDAKHQGGPIALHSGGPVMPLVAGQPGVFPSTSTVSNDSSSSTESIQHTYFPGATIVADLDKAERYARRKQRRDALIKGK